MNADGGEVTGVVTSGRKLSRGGWRRAQDRRGVEECKSWRSEKGLSQEHHRMERHVRVACTDFKEAKRMWREKASAV